MDTALQVSPLELDEAGLLVDPGVWDATVAQQIATQVGVGVLGEDHWKVIEALRKHYEKFGVAPAMNNICRTQGKSRMWVHELFGTCLNAWRVAGLPNPGEEAKSYLNNM